LQTLDFPSRFKIISTTPTADYSSAVGAKLSKIRPFGVCDFFKIGTLNAVFSWFDLGYLNKLFNKSRF